MKLRWFLSGTVREATEMCSHVRKLTRSQSDLLSTEALSAIETTRAELQQAIDNQADNETVKEKMGELEVAANKWLKPYPHSNWRENVEVFLVAIAVAMAIRTFFLQPFKIPTGSMQPTLYGIEYERVEKIPGRLGRIWDACVEGSFYHHLVAEADGHFLGINKPKSMLRFINKQEIVMAYQIDGQIVQKAHTLWFAPGDENQKYLEKSGLRTDRLYKKGEDILKIKEVAGDHLFVDRFTYNFRVPMRGEIIVFKTRGILHPNMQQDQFYIKRLVALGGETVSLGNDQHLRIDGVRMDASTPRFENVYTFPPEPVENGYFGHVNELTARRFKSGGLAPYFFNEEQTFLIPADHYMVMGDNTLHSFDSRGWGAFPSKNVIGKSFFVYWPIANHGESRFGWGHW